MLEELERRKQEQIEEARRREVRNLQILLQTYTRRRTTNILRGRGNSNVATPQLRRNTAAAPPTRQKF